MWITLQCYVDYFKISLQCMESLTLLDCLFGLFAWEVNKPVCGHISDGAHGDNVTPHPTSPIPPSLSTDTTYNSYPQPVLQATHPNSLPPLPSPSPYHPYPSPLHHPHPSQPTATHPRPGSISICTFACTLSMPFSRFSKAPQLFS